MHIALCDDSSADRREIRTLLNELKPRAQIAEFESAEALLAAHRSGKPFDLVFMDILLDGMDGMDAAARLREVDERLSLVFLTMSRDYAVESYQVSALSYLVKPLRAEALAAVLERFDAVWRPRSIFINDRFFTMDDIVSAESRNKHVTFSFRDGTSAEITAKLGEVERQLHGSNFLRCHRSFIINMDHVARISDKCFITMTGGTILIRQKQYATLKKTYYDYITSR